MRDHDVALIPESPLAHKYLDGLSGLEIGGGAHSQFGLKTKNVDYTLDVNTPCKLQEIAMCGETLPVDILASGDDIPVADGSQDFVVSSHSIEHFFDPIAALNEWMRVVRPGGYIYMIIPHPERTFDKGRPLTTLQELIDRHEGMVPQPDAETWAKQPHFSVWDVPRFMELCSYLKMKVIDSQEVDDRGHNGFTIVVRKDA